MTASVGSLIVGSGTLSTRTSRLPWNVRAFISNQPPCGIALVHPVTSTAGGANGGHRGTTLIDAGAPEHPPGVPNGMHGNARYVPFTRSAMKTGASRLECA